MRISFLRYVCSAAAIVMLTNVFGGTLPPVARTAEHAVRAFTEGKALPDMPDLTKPVYLRAKALVCRSSSMFASGAYDAMLKGDANSVWLLQQYCVQVPSSLRVRLIPPSELSEYAAAYLGGYVRMVAPNASMSDATQISGYVAVKDLTGAPASAPAKARSAEAINGAPSELPRTRGSATHEPNLLLTTRFGDLTTGEDSLIRFRGRKLSRDVEVTSPVYVEAAYQFEDSDAVLISLNRGNRCGGRFVFLTLSTRGASVTPDFGTCIVGIEAVRDGQSVRMTLTNDQGPGNVRYVYANGVVTKK